jgi:hypothetical protein
MPSIQQNSDVEMSLFVLEINVEDRFGGLECTRDVKT